MLIYVEYLTEPEQNEGFVDYETKLVAKPKGNKVYCHIIFSTFANEHFNLYYHKMHMKYGKISSKLLNMLVQISMI